MELLLLQAVHFTFSTDQQLLTTQDSVSLLIHLVYNGGMRADRNGAWLPAWLDRHSAFIFTGDFMPGGIQNCTVKARFRGNQSERGWCHYYVVCFAFDFIMKHYSNNLYCSTACLMFDFVGNLFVVLELSATCIFNKSCHMSCQVKNAKQQSKY